MLCKNTVVTESTRVQFDLPPQSLQRLKDLKELTEATSYAEVIRKALKVYEWAIESKGSGYSLIVRNAEGRERRLLTP